MPSWALMVGLVGEGQHIHIGEEAGLAQWNSALKSMRQPWTVHCPSTVAPIFTGATKVLTSDHLNLNTSLRTHLAEDVQVWITQLLLGQIKAAKRTARNVTSQGFDMYVTRHLSRAKEYVQLRYAGQLDKRYGILASSRAYNLPDCGVQNSYASTRNLREGPWYNDPPDSPLSCCQLTQVATEFACQGLELDFPILAWGTDLSWYNEEWHSPRQTRSTAHNPHMLRLNSYRVLLSRGRNGFVVFVSPEPRMDETYEALLAAGLKYLPSQTPPPQIKHP
jgi:DUF2075 family protein